ncbi:HAMP domain-containing sensor histidine kinase [Flavobacterium sp.]|uniref:sensor histidine kinase n=1 Tax=Flavobacterium sp. TaxID=239 RepID=UPI002601FD59|nr:HAMP domain-containing sensor histidine kinase [Flavobacterium sp.]
MFEKIRNKYLYNKTQVVVLNKQGTVIKSDDLLFNVPKKTSISNFHPFFETIISLIDLEYNEFTFSCIHIDVNNIKKTVDVIFNSGSSNENPFLILIDFTEHYNNFQSIAQEKNESVLSFHLSELKNQQLESEKNFKNKFLANVSHDLKTPIWGLKFFLNFLEKTNLTDDQLDYVKTLKDTTTHIHHLVQDLLDLSKIESGQMNIVKEKFSLSEGLTNLLSIIKPKVEEKNIEFNVNIQDKITDQLIGDKIRLNQILINLLDNSIKFTKKGTITFEISVESFGETFIALKFIVKDTGTGFSSSQKSDVFQSFKKLHNSRKIEGLGLGLSIVSNLVELMNGKIDYQTEIRKGTTFEVILPFEIAK